MRSGSIGTPAASPSRRRNGSRRRDGDRRRAGFTLIEALAALTLVLAFAGALAPLLFQARRVMVNSQGRVAAQVLLRSLLAAPLDPSTLSNTGRDGETAGLQWRLAAAPMDAGATSSPDGAGSMDIDARSRQERPDWRAFRVVARVSWGPGQSISAETVRLGKAE
jgi:type II secretory pathway pseudopilin PulG